MDYSSLGSEPVTAGQPVGRDVRYEDIFEELQSEIDKLTSPSERDLFSWKTVADLASTILRDHSKDLLVASYLSVALVNLEGWKGFGDASTIYHDLLERYWEAFFPPKKRMRGRIAALEWWIEKTDAALAGEMPGRTDPETSRHILENLERIDTFLRANIEAEISLPPLIRKVETILLQEVPQKEESEVPAGNHKVAEPLGEREVDLNPAGELSDVKEAVKSVLPLFQKIKQAATLLREEKLHDPQPYRWLRFAVWEPVKALPVASGGVTKIPPPPQQAVTHLNGLRDDEDWETLISHSEGRLYNSQYIFLLDLNRFTAESLSNLGRKYRAASEVVCRETALFIHRLPGLENLSFSDGTPFANEETMEWLAQINRDGLPEESDEIALPVSAEDDGISGEIKTAKALAKEEGKLLEAVHLLQNRINGSLAGKEAMLLRLGLIQLLRDNKSETVAMPHVEIILNDIVKFRLDRWEPEVALKGLKTVYLTFKTLADKKRSAEVLSLIANINTVEAMKLQDLRGTR